MATVLLSVSASQKLIWFVRMNYLIMSCAYLSVFAARYECKSCWYERIHLTQFHVDLHVEAATIHDTGTLHGTLSNVWKASDSSPVRCTAHWATSGEPPTPHRHTAWHTEQRLQSLRRPSDSQRWSVRPRRTSISRQELSTLAWTTWANCLAICQTLK